MSKHMAKPSLEQRKTEVVKRLTWLQENASKLDPDEKQFYIEYLEETIVWLQGI